MQRTHTKGRKETKRLMGVGVGEGGGGGYKLYLSLHCHHRNDPRMTCIKMGGDESYFHVLLTVRDKATRQCPQTTTFEEKGEPKRIRIEVLQLTILTPYRSAKPAHENPAPSPCNNKTSKVHMVLNVLLISPGVFNGRKH